MKIRSKQKQAWRKIDEEQGIGVYESLTEQGLFQLRLRNDTRYVRRVFRAISPRRAMEKASEMIPEILGTAIRAEQPRVFEIAEAFDMALGRSTRGTDARKDWERQVDSFMLWLHETHPEVNHWGALSRSMVWEYMTTFEGKSANTKRLYLQPLVQTSGLMSREFGFPNFAERLNIGSKLVNPPAMVYLIDVVDFCDWLAARPEWRWLEAGVALQGLAGLRVSELLRLTWDKVDLESGLIEVSGNTKNEYSCRVIPIAERVLLALQQAKQGKTAADKPKIQLIQEPVIATADGEPYGDYSFYSLKLKAARKQWIPRITWKPKDLRNALPTFGTSEGIWSSIHEQYIGHAPGTVTARHYVPRLGWASSGEKQALEKQMELFRRHVVEPVNEALKKQDKTVNVRPMYNNATETV